jgi:hypothetical protein
MSTDRERGALMDGAKACRDDLRRAKAAWQAAQAAKAKPGLSKKPVEGVPRPDAGLWAAQAGKVLGDRRRDQSSDGDHIAVTFFKDYTANTKREQIYSLEELAKEICKTTALTKDVLPWLKFARFGDIKSEMGSLRHDANVTGITGVEADYDGEVVSFDEAVKIAEKAGLLAIIYTSPSHKQEAPRWRVICPTSIELPPDQRRHLMARLNGLYRGIFAAESWALSQSYVYGSVDNNPDHRVEIVDGEFIDLLDELDLIAIARPAAKKATTGGNKLNGSGAAIALEDLAGWARGLITEGASEGKKVRQRGKQFFEIVKYLRSKDYTAAQVIELLARHPDGVAGKYDGRLDTEVARAWDKVAVDNEVIEKFNARYAVVNEAGKAFVYEQVYDQQLEREILIRITFSDLRKFYQNRRIQVGDTMTTEADHWLNSPNRRQYLAGVVFDPTGNAPADCWNLWSGFAVEPREGDWSLMRTHIRDVICAGNAGNFEYTLNWTARMFQKPNRPGEVATVLKGLKGVGKGIFFHYLRKAWGQHGVYITNAKHLVGNFNAHLRDCVFLFADEAFFAGDREHESVLKSLITDPVLPIEGKYQNVVNLANMLHVGMASNADWVIPASHDERRYFAQDVSDKHRGDKKYFEAIGAQMDSGGLAAMIHELLDRDISAFDVGAIPNTDALITQKKLSLDTLDRWLIAVLERGFVWRSRHGLEQFYKWQEFYATELLDRSHQQWCVQNRVSRPATRELLGKRMTEIYGLSSRPAERSIIGEADSTALLDRIDGHVVNSDELIQWRPSARGYQFGCLKDAREAFSQKRGVAGDWGENSEGGGS